MKTKNEKEMAPYGETDAMTRVYMGYMGTQKNLL